MIGLPGQRPPVTHWRKIWPPFSMKAAHSCLIAHFQVRPSPYLGTELIAAAHLGHAEVVRRLIDAGAPLDHINNLHWTAVMEAVVLGDGSPDHQAVLEALLSAGADALLADRDGVTPLQHAQTREFAEMEKPLARPN